MTRLSARTTETYATTENAMDSKNVMTANSSNHVGVLVGANGFHRVIASIIAASIIFASMISLIIYFYKRRNRAENRAENRAKKSSGTQTTFHSTEKGSYEKQSRISRFSEQIYDELYEGYEAYLSRMKSTFKNRTISF